MKLHILQKETIIEQPINTVFDFFSKAENLNLLTPPSLDFNILTKPPIEMKLGSIIDYTIKISGIRVKWKTEITKWQPPNLFEDTQLNGPYKVWIHEHKFREDGKRTIMTDTVKYRSPGGMFEFIPHLLFVRKRVKSIFDYRSIKLKDMFI
ncbi:MAG: CDP-paratose 2-epimerase [Ignavibacteriae bacterium]|nr:MAG: CDP-paratose 2-epimerase [Ignavibacteriota bacterium]